MRRKLVKQGPASTTISLPASWVQAHHLKPGDEVDVQVTGNKIIIATEGQTQPELLTSIDVTHMSDLYLKVLLSGLHKLGLDEIRLSTRPQQIAIIEERVTRHLLGYEIIQQNKEQVTIRAVMRAEPEELATLMRRSFLVTITLAEGVASEERSADLILLESTNNRLTNYCERIIARNVDKQEGAIFLYIIMWLLEKIADEYRDILVANSFQIKDARIAATHLKAVYELNYKFSFERHDALAQELATTATAFESRKSPFASIILLLRNMTGSLIALHAPTERRAS